MENRETGAGSAEDVPEGEKQPLLPEDPLELATARFNAIQTELATEESKTGDDRNPEKIQDLEKELAEYSKMLVSLQPNPEVLSQGEDRPVEAGETNPNLTGDTFIGPIGEPPADNSPKPELWLPENVAEELGKKKKTKKQKIVIEVAKDLGGGMSEEQVAQTKEDRKGFAEIKSKKDAAEKKEKDIRKKQNEGTLLSSEEKTFLRSMEVARETEEKEGNKTETPAVESPVAEKPAVEVVDDDNGITKEREAITEVLYQEAQKRMEALFEDKIEKKEVATKEQYMSESKIDARLKEWQQKNNIEAPSQLSAKDKEEFGALATGQTEHGVLTSDTVKLLFSAGLSLEDIKNIKYPHWWSGKIRSKFSKDDSGKVVVGGNFNESAPEEFDGMVQNWLKQKVKESLEKEYDVKHQELIERWTERELAKTLNPAPEEKKAANPPETPDFVEIVDEEEKKQKIKKMALLWRDAHEIDRVLRKRKGNFKGFEYKIENKKNNTKKQWWGKRALERAKKDKNEMSKELVALAQEISGRNFKNDAAKIKKKWPKKELERYLTDQVMEVMNANGISFIKEPEKKTSKPEPPPLPKKSSPPSLPDFDAKVLEWLSEESTSPPIEPSEPSLENPIPEPLPPLTQEPVVENTQEPLIDQENESQQGPLGESGSNPELQPSKEIEIQLSEMEKRRLEASAEINRMRRYAGTPELDREHPIKPEETKFYNEVLYRRNEATAEMQTEQPKIEVPKEETKELTQEPQKKKSFWNWIFGK